MCDCCAVVKMHSFFGAHLSPRAFASSVHCMYLCTFCSCFSHEVTFETNYEVIKEKENDRMISCLLLSSKHFP